MDSNARELLDLVFRWIHVIAGIMWVGNSMLFNWLDRNLILPPASQPGSTAGMIGEIWMVHSGGFYQVEKKQLAPSQMPAVLHWFKWQSYITWITGICLLAIVYYTGGATYLVDADVSAIRAPAAIGLGIGVIAGGFLVYDLLWRSPIAKYESVATGISLTFAAGVVYALTHLLSGRAAFIHVGAMLGTLMAGNVFFHIIPSQRALVAATASGKPQDMGLSAHAKQRSIHNNYMTFPLLFTMLSNHFPSAYGSRVNWAILGVLFVGGATVRHFMNIRFTFKQWIPALAATVTATLTALLFLMVRPSGAATAAGPIDLGPPVSYTTVRLIMNKRCLPCHSAMPTDDVWKQAPVNVMFDRPDQVQKYAERIQARAVISKTMPLGNKTGMTDDEREVMGHWLLQGASTQ